MNTDFSRIKRLPPYVFNITGELKINIRSMNLSPMREGRIGGVINIEVTNTSIIDMVAANLMKIKGVEKAYRITGQV